MHSHERSRMRFALVLSLTFVGIAAGAADQSWGCQPSYDHELKSKLVTNIEFANSLCSSILDKFGATNQKCLEGVARESADNDLFVEVLRRPDNAFPKYNVWIRGPSSRMAGIRRWGFESHRFAILFFFDFECRLNIYAVNHQPRYLAGDAKIARDAANPNWRFFEDGDPLTTLQSKIWQSANNALLTGH